MGNGCFYADRLAAGYGKRPVAEGLSFHAGRGEIVTLIGPNGAGKSTILKTISGGLAPMGGELVLDGVPMERIPRKERARKLAVVFTEKLQGELMTCQDVTAAGRYPYTGRLGLLSEKDQRAVDQALELVHGTDLGDRPFDRISDGQRQRIMLARALCQEPEMILLDEPTSHLDVKYKLEFLSLLREMARKKELSVIMSLHELDLAERISDRVVCIKDGRMDRCGTPEQVFTPGYVEELFGMTAGRFDAAGGAVEFSVPGGAGRPEELPENAVFVIAGNGSGRQVFRKLQRENVPFVTGILFENDLDLPAAEALAAHVVKVPLGPVPEEAVREARVWIRRCRKVICCRTGFGVWEKENEDLFKYAERSGKDRRIIVTDSRAGRRPAGLLRIIKAASE